MADIYLLIDAQQQGPYSEEDLRQFLTEGRITNDVLAWREGMTEWVAISEVLSNVTRPAMEPQIEMHVSPTSAKQIVQPSATKPPLIFVCVVVLVLILGAYIFWPDPLRRDINKITIGMSSPELLTAIGQPEKKTELMGGGSEYTYINKDDTRMLIVFVDGSDTICGWALFKKESQKLGSDGKIHQEWNVVTGKGHDNEGAGFPQ